MHETQIKSETERQRSYLTHVLQRTGWTQSELASRAGLDPSTLSRFLSGSREGHALRLRSVEKIAAISGIAYDSQGPSAIEPAGAATNQGFAESEASPIQVAAHTPLAQIIDVLCRQRINTDPWTLHSRALEGAGYRPGDLLIVALGETPLSGDVVCAQVYDWTSGKAETVFRIFEPPYLVAASPDPQFLRPLIVDGDKIHIKGVVVQTLRIRRQ